MKSFRQLLPLLALAGASAEVAAQGVTIFGIVDTHLSYTDASVQRTAVAEGGHSASRLGFRGREDLGGGMAAYFTLEMGLNVDNGSIPLTGGFGRQSFVGLSGPWGAVELGRQYTPIFFNMLAVAPFGMNVNWAPVQLVTSSDGQPAAARTLGFPLRQDNLVRYRWGANAAARGFRAEAAYAPGESATASGRVHAAATSYRGQNYFVGYGFQRTHSGNAAGPAFYNELQGLSLGYDLGALALSANYMVTRTTLAGGRKAAHTILGASYTMGPHILLAEVNRRDLKGSANDATLLTLGYDYTLSKRTALYTRLLGLNNRATAANTMAQATVNNNSGDDVRALAIGIRHNF